MQAVNDSVDNQVVLNADNEREEEDWELKMKEEEEKKKNQNEQNSIQKENIVREELNLPLRDETYTK